MRSEVVVMRVGKEGERESWKKKRGRWRDVISFLGQNKRFTHGLRKSDHKF